MTELTVYSITRAGVNAPTLYTTLMQGGTADTFANDNVTFVHIMNGSTVGTTISATITATVDGVTPTAKTVAVPALDAGTTGSVFFGVFPDRFYGNTVTLTSSAGEVSAIKALVLSIGS